jgi:hypothetical protein
MIFFLAPFSVGGAPSEPRVVGLELLGFELLGMVEEAGLSAGATVREEEFAERELWWRREASVNVRDCAGVAAQTAAAGHASIFCCFE